MTTDIIVYVNVILAILVAVFFLLSLDFCAEFSAIYFFFSKPPPTLVCRLNYCFFSLTFDQIKIGMGIMHSPFGTFMNICFQALRHCHPLAETQICILVYHSQSKIRSILYWKICFKLISCGYESNRFFLK